VRPLILQSGGTNSAYTTYPDGCAFLERFAGWSLVRGDEIFGWGPFSSDYEHALALLDIDWRRNRFLRRCDIDGIRELVASCGLPLEHGSPEVDRWKQRFYRQVRIPNFIMPVARYQMKHCDIELPFLTRAFQDRMTATAPALRANKKIAIDALTAATPKHLADIPLATGRNWQQHEPFLCLPNDTLAEIVSVLRRADGLRPYIDIDSVLSSFEAQVAGTYRSYRPAWAERMRRFPKYGRIADHFVDPRVTPAILVKNLYAMHTFLFT
jgi:hypothetical protein